MVITVNLPPSISESRNREVILDAETISIEGRSNACVTSAQGLLICWLDDNLVVATARFPVFASITAHDDLVAPAPATAQGWAIVSEIPHRCPIARIGDTFSVVASIVALIARPGAALPCAVDALACELCILLQVLAARPKASTNTISF